MSKYDEGFCEYPEHVTNSYVKAMELTKKLGCTLKEAFELLTKKETNNSKNIKENKK